MKTRLLVSFPDEPFLLPEFLEQAQSIPGIECKIFHDKAVDQEQLLARSEKADVLVVDMITNYGAELLTELPELKVIITTTVGVEHIDLDFCTANDIRVMNFPGFNARAVAEAVFAYALTLARQLPHAWQNVLGGGWNTFRFQGFELAGKTIGVVGAGHVGAEIIGMANGLGMEVLCHTKHPTAKRGRGLGLSKFSDLDDLLANSDFVVLSVPLTPETHRLIAAPQFDIMRETAFLINVSRWAVVDVKALASSVYEHRIGGAALDFVGPEPYNLLTSPVEIQELVNSPNVLLLPHLGFNTYESNVRLGNRLVETLTDLAQEVAG